MRTVCSAFLFAGAVTLVSSSGLVAAPIDGSAIKAAAEEIAISQNVHCRPFRHMHRSGYHRGCRSGVVIYDRGPRVRARVGIGVRDGVRTRTGVSIRSGTRDSTTVRGSTTIRSGGTDGRAPGTVSGGGTREGAGGGRASGGTSTTTPPASQGGQTGQGGGATGSGGSQKQ